MTLGGTVGHAQVTERVSQKNDAVSMNQLLKVVRLVQCILVLVENMDQSTVETFQQTLKISVPPSFMIRHRH